ncbi:hypothetical protein Glove_384g22 [Diversispora epigaea]|uniref:Uncharacterized protein n=1 Tax=Diversispora epigaea TaxID=1348612 RepID=A0A397H740_9GLOM|nr:hypothetical protein Glove_384g22 [Diversispora epigaea]
MNKTEILIDAYSAADYFQLPKLQDHIINKLEEILSNNSKENVSPQLLTKVVGGVIPNSDQPLTDLLAKCVTKIPLETIPYGSLSSPAFQFLLMYCTKEKISQAKNQSIPYLDMSFYVQKTKSNRNLGRCIYENEACLPPLDKILEKEHVTTS